jgi:hypothetical protein
MQDIVGMLEGRREGVVEVDEGRLGREGESGGIVGGPRGRGRVIRCWCRLAGVDGPLRLRVEWRRRVVHGEMRRRSGKFDGGKGGSRSVDVEIVLLSAV